MSHAWWERRGGTDGGALQLLCAPRRALLPIGCLFATRATAGGCRPAFVLWEPRQHSRLRLCVGLTAAVGERERGEGSRLQSDDARAASFSPRTALTHSSPTPAALNPTYTYGKRAPSTTSADTGPSAAAAAAVKGATPPLDTAASRAAARRPPPPGGPVKRFDHHGHKASLLAARLPPTPGEAGAGVSS